MEEPKRCWRLRHRDGFRSGFPHLGTTFGTGSLFMGGRPVCRTVWSSVPCVDPTGAKSIPSCAVQKSSRGFVPYPLQEGVTVTPVEDGLWKGRQDGVRQEMAQEETWVVNGLQNTWDHLEAICRVQEGNPSDRSWKVSWRCFKLPKCWMSPFPWKPN